MRIYEDILIRVSREECVGRFVVPDGIREIEAFAFQGCYELTELVLPDGLKLIKRYAFADCTMLEKIHFPDSDSITFIEEMALTDTNWYKRQKGDFIMPAPHYLLKYTGRKLDVVIPDGVKHIADSAFDEKNIRTVKFPAGLKTIGSAAFRRCNNLRAVELPEGLESIGNQCFYNCASLTDIYAPDSINSVGLGAFEETPWHKKAVTAEGCIMLNNNMMIDYRGSEEDIVLPEGVEHIAADAFGECDGNLKSVILPEGVKTIGSVFLDWKRELERVVIPSTVERWGTLAFMNSIIQQLELNFSVEKSIYEVLEDERVLAQAEIHRIYAPNIPISAMDKFKKPAAVGFAEMCMQGRQFPKRFAEDYKRYIRGQRLKLYPLFSENLLLARFMCAEKMIPLEHIDNAIEQAGDNFEVRAMLMDYKNNSFTFEDEEKLMMKELNKDPFSITEMKKVWGYSVNEDDTLTLKSYKGTGGDVVIPETIGKRSVSVIGAKAFFPMAGMTDKIKAGREQVR